MKNHYKPIRTCLGCRQKSYQDQLLRLNLDSKGRIIIVQPNSLSLGRSIYLCYSKSCIEHLLKSKVIVFKSSKICKITAKLSDYESAKLKFRLFRALTKFKEILW